MSHALSLPLAIPVRLDFKRIAGYSLSLALNVTAMLALTLPLPLQMKKQASPVAPLSIVFQTPPKVIPVVDPPVMPVLPVHHTAVVTTPHPLTHTPVQSAPVTEPSAVATPVTVAPVVSGVPREGPVAPLSESSLAYAAAPAPAYPVQARRMQWEGTVVFRVLVDVDGKPLQVVVERSSGHRELDRAAQLQIMSRWRFHPAQEQGHLRQAWARVPVTFSLNH